MMNLLNIHPVVLLKELMRNKISFCMYENYDTSEDPFYSAPVRTKATFIVDNKNGTIDTVTYGIDDKFYVMGSDVYPEFEILYYQHNGKTTFDDALQYHKNKIDEASMTITVSYAGGIV